MKITIITPTGDRPASLSRQSRYIGRSILPKGTELDWIIIDDGKNPFNPSVPSVGKKIYFRVQPQQGFTSSLISNLRLGICHAITLDPDFVFIWEDDDWYSPYRILDQMEHLQKDFDIHGYQNSLYYHVPSQRYREMKNKAVSLFEMAFVGKLLIPILYLIEGQEEDGKGLDVKIWRRFGKGNAPQRNKYDSIGLKGLSGRLGMGVGHHPSGSWIQDTDHTFLTRLTSSQDVEEIIKDDQEHSDSVF